MAKAERVAVVGGGVIGLAVARALAIRRLSVVVVDAGYPAGNASQAAAGMLSPLAETGDLGPLHTLADASLDLYADFVAAIEAESGIGVEYRTCGKLHVAVREAEAAGLDHLAALPSAARFGVESLSGAEARRLEPALSDAVFRALLVQRDHRVDNRRLHHALRAAAQKAGVELRSEAVDAIECAAGRATGLRLQDGSFLSSDAVILAAGAWSGRIAGITPPPVRPVRGQMLAVHGGGRLLQRVVASQRCYLIPRDDGRLLIGATVEESGFSEGTTPEGIAGLRTAASELLPRLRSMRETEQWFGFRPGTPDGLPILGEDDAVHGLYHATGHHRNGILLAPVTAELVAATVAGERPIHSLDPFSIGRFRS